mgnify:CR=1 FL=1
MNKIARFLSITLASASFVLAQQVKRPPLPPELKESADKIRKAVESGEITHEQAKKKHEDMIRDFKAKIGDAAKEAKKGQKDQQNHKHFASPNLPKLAWTSKIF